MDDRAAALLTVPAVLLVLFSALIDPRLTVILATILIAVGVTYAFLRAPKT